MPTFSGTSYLGLDQHPEFIQLVHEGLARYGVHYGGSRRSPLAPDIFAEAEAYLAKWTGAPAALLVSSGTSAGQLVVRYVASQHYQFHYSPGVHPALWWPESKEHLDWRSWGNSIRPSYAAGLTDAIDPLAVQRPDWAILPDGGKGIVVVDDSHVIGVLGVEGAGSWCELSSCWAGELIVTASLGKALSLPAGVILGSEKLVAALREQPQFGGASPPSPAPIYAFMQATALIRSRRTALRERIAYLQTALEAHPDLRFLPGYPIIAMKKHAWVERLALAGIEISSFHYPTAASPRYSRIVVRADQEWEQLKALVQILQQV